MNKTVLIIIILIIIVGGYFLFRGGYQAPTLAPEVAEPTLFPEPQPEADEPQAQTPISEVKDISVSGTEFSFSPSSLTFTAGEQVRLTFNNVGNAPHNLTIEGTNIGTKTIAASKADVIEFTAPVSGTYTIFCSVPSHRALGMEGTLTVSK